MLVLLFPILGGLLVNSLNSELPLKAALADQIKNPVIEAVYETN